MIYLYFLGYFIVRILPRSVSYRLAEICGLFQYYFSRKDRLSVLANLRPIILDENKLIAIAKKVFINFGYYLVDFFNYCELDKKFIEKYVKIEGRDIWDQALAAKQGVIALTAHIGNYELGGAVTALLGYPLHAIALPHKDKRVNNFFNHQRQLTGINIIAAGTAVKSCYSLLKKGKITAFLGDKDFFGHGIEVNMFSRKVLLPRGAAFFASKTGAIIIPSFFLRENKFYYKLIFEKPISVDYSDPEAETKIISAYVNILQAYIKKYPDQWYVFGKYWQD